jgi:hypothetical protein
LFIDAIEYVELGSDPLVIVVCIAFARYWAEDQADRGAVFRPLSPLSQ